MFNLNQQLLHNHHQLSQQPLYTNSIAATQKTMSSVINLTEKSDEYLIFSLQADLHFFRAKIQELESQNDALSRQLANCRCQEIKVNHTCGIINDEGLVEKTQRLQLGKNKVNRKKTKKTTSDSGAIINWQFERRFIALKIMYFGKRFYGFASEAQMDPTVESEIFKALEKTRLINGDKKDLQYSRCGRTDKGVSSVGQVIALYLRSNHKERGGEIDYVRLLNRVLPDDIRVMGWSPAPNGFSARFSCLSRVYKYFFWKENLNTKAMETAGMKFIGEHDFRNFCKMDAASVHNYRRHVKQFEIFCCDERNEGEELWMIKIKGTAFLWHQIRCMVALLFLIGQDLESSDVIDELLNIERTPRKPQYKMAPELPLVLESCEFEELKFICSSDAAQALRVHLDEEHRNYKLQAAIFNEALISLWSFENDFSILDQRSRKKEPSHIPLMSRPTEPSYEERRAKLNKGLVG